MGKQNMIRPSGNVLFTRPQLECVVHNLLTGFCDTIDSCFVAKELPSCPEAHVRWLEERACAGWDADEFMHATMNQLAHSLSNFFATVTNDGMGYTDALQIANVGTVLTNWANSWINGEIGLQLNAAGVYEYNRPDLEGLAKEWCNVFSQEETLAIIHLTSDDGEHLGCAIVPVGFVSRM